MTASIDADRALRVALLEDDLLLRDRVLLPGLRDFGFEVIGLETAAELHEHLKIQPTDIVVLDVGLPDQSGFMVARQLRSQSPSLGIVMLTGRGETPDRVRGLSEGADRQSDEDHRPQPAGQLSAEPGERHGADHADHHQRRDQVDDHRACPKQASRQRSAAPQAGNSRRAGRRAPGRDIAVATLEG